MAKITVVDRNDRVIGAERKVEALKKGLIHRIVRVFIYNSKGEIFLQKRSPDMKVWPNCWDQSVGGHVDEGETYEQAAYRETKEELGISDVNLVEKLKYYQEEEFNDLLLKRFNVIFTGKYNGDISLDKEELSGGSWFNEEYLKTWIKKKPEDFASGCIFAFNKLIKSKKN